MAHKEQGYRFENDYPIDHMKNTVDGIGQVIVVPVNTEIKQDQTVLNLDRVKKIVSDSKKITLMDCSCRVDMKHCNHPVETCLTFDGKADEMLTLKDVQRLNPHPITKDEAMSVLKMSSEAGLLHLAYIDRDDKEKKIHTVCSCCSCSCEVLGAILRYGLAPHLLKGSGKTSTDESKCNGCGICEDRCNFGARKMNGGSLVFDKGLCYGCGLCVSTCPTQAISLTQVS